MLNDFILILPEEILGLGGLALMMAAAWGATRPRRC